MSEQKQSFQFVIRERWCKGCNICVAFCPKQVLVLRNGKVFPEHPEKCIGCHMCEMRCPDYAIEVHSAAEKVTPDLPEVDYTLPPEAGNA